MKKAFLSFLLMLLMAVTSNAATLIDGIYYNLNSTTMSAEVTSGTTKYKNDVVIPGMVTYNNTVYVVTGIGAEAFKGCTNLTSVTIPATVTTIGSDAFYLCDKLTSIDIPSSVTSIGRYAFANCSRLTELTIPNSVTTIDNRAFYSCTSLTSVDIPNSVTYIGSNAFDSCSKLENITIHNPETAIWSGAFNGTAWYNSQAVGPVYIDNILYTYKGTINGNIDIQEGTVTISPHAFNSQQNLTGVTFPNSLTTIGDYAFYHCNGLTNVTIGNSVKSIGQYAFYDCDALTSVEIPNSAPTSIADHAFSDCDALTSVVIGNSATSIGEFAFYDGNALKSVTIGNSVTSIGEHAFYYCPALESVTIPSSLTSLEQYVFSCCYNLKNVTIPSSVKSIASGAFYYCTSMESIDIPGSVTSIGAYAFYRCSSLNKVTIGDGIKQIGSYAFANSGTSLINLYCYAEEVPFAAKDAFYNAKDIQLHVPEQSIEAYGKQKPWSDCWNITSEDTEIEKCATPTINFTNGKLSFSCETEDAVFIYDIQMTSDNKVGAGEEVLVAPTCTVSVIATKPGFRNSDEVTLELDLSGSAINGDLNADGNVDAVDIAKLVDKIIKKNQ